MTEVEAAVSFNEPSPKIFLYTEVLDGENEIMAYALAEDGSDLIGIRCHGLYAKSNLSNVVAKAVYERHYPQGYTLVDLLNTTPEDHKDFMWALRLNHEQGG